MIRNDQEMISVRLDNWVFCQSQKENQRLLPLMLVVCSKKT